MSSAAQVDCLPGSVGDVSRLIRTGAASTRPLLARRTGLAPSTVGLRVEQLLKTGYFAEVGVPGSRGGGHARRIALVESAACVAAAVIGERRVKVAIANLGGRILAQRSATIDPSRSPEAVVAEIWQTTQALMTEVHVDIRDLAGIAIGVPGPIEHATGRVIYPSFMPTWHDVSLSDLLAAHVNLPAVVVENDANLVALFEASQTGRPDDHLVAVVLGRRIGSGIILGGQLQRGYNGAAGEISHVAVPGTSAIPCVCGVPNCLESVAGGTAIAARLRSMGYSVDDMSDVIALSQSTNPDVLEIFRDAGTQIGIVLGSMVNLVNPRKVVLCGRLSSCVSVVASIRSELFRRCLPISAQDLDVSATTDVRGGELKGAVQAILDEALAPGRFEHMVSSSGDA